MGQSHGTFPHLWGCFENRLPERRPEAPLKIFVPNLSMPCGIFGAFSDHPGIIIMGITNFFDGIFLEHVKTLTEKRRENVGKT